jgi:hypothetical protein
VSGLAGGWGAQTGLGYDVGLREQMGLRHTGALGLVSRDGGDGSWAVLLDDNDGTEISAVALDGVTPAVGDRVVLLFVNAGRAGVILGRLG